MYLMLQSEPATLRQLRLRSLTPPLGKGGFKGGYVMLQSEWFGLYPNVVIYLTYDAIKQNSMVY